MPRAFMSRFRWTTLAAGLLIAGAAVFLDGRARQITIASIASAYVVLFALGVPLIRMQYFCRAICRGKPGRMRVALTFDDGPDPVATPALLDLLRRENVKATFFLIGRNVDAHPQIAKRIAEEGHLLGNHTYNHFWWTSLLFAGALTEEINLTQSAIERGSGVVPVWFRPPVGLTNPHFHTALQRTGLRMAGWDVRPKDTARPPREVIDHVLAHARDGSIVLLHDGAGRQAVAETVASLIDQLRARGYSFVRIDELNEFPQS